MAIDIHCKRYRRQTNKSTNPLCHHGMSKEMQGKEKCGQWGGRKKGAGEEVMEKEKVRVMIGFDALMIHDA